MPSSSAEAVEREVIRANAKGSLDQLRVLGELLSTQPFSEEAHGRLLEGVSAVVQLARTLAPTLIGVPTNPFPSSRKHHIKNLGRARTLYSPTSNVHGRSGNLPDGVQGGDGSFTPGMIPRNSSSVRSVSSAPGYTGHAGASSSSSAADSGRPEKRIRDDAQPMPGTMTRTKKAAAAVRAREGSARGDGLSFIARTQAIIVGDRVDRAYGNTPATEMTLGEMTGIMRIDQSAPKPTAAWYPQLAMMLDAGEYRRMCGAQKNDE
jgi:hypothetical protein